MTVERAAKAEAHKRYDGDRVFDDLTGEEVSFDDWGYSETERAGFVAGATWLAEHLLSDESVERAAFAGFSLDGDSDRSREIWNGMTEDAREASRAYARRVLSAALGIEVPA